MLSFQQSRTRVVGTCLTFDERRAVESIARVCGVSLSAVVRAAVVQLLEAPAVTVGRFVEEEVKAHAGTG